MPKRSPFVFLPQPEATDENPVGFSLLFCHRKLIIVSREQKVTLSLHHASFQNGWSRQTYCLFLLVLCFSCQWVMYTRTMAVLARAQWACLGASASSELRQWLWQLHTQCPRGCASLFQFPLVPEACGNMRGNFVSGAPLPGASLVLLKISGRLWLLFVCKAWFWWLVCYSVEVSGTCDFVCCFST